MRKTNIAIIGAGASGLMAAYQASVFCKQNKKEICVTVFEGNNRAGKKLLATGNGRCNLTNLHVSPEMYHGDRQIDEILKQISVEQVLTEFRKIGILCRQDEVGRVYPYNLQAAAVLKALRQACEENGVLFCYEQKVNSIVQISKGFLLKIEKGEEVLADQCILACGGQASPKHSCDVNGYTLAQKLGHTIIKLSPALSSVLCKAKVLSSIKGLRCKAKVKLLGDGLPLYAESGEVIFADKALSGICIFNISVLVADYIRFGIIQGKKFRQLSIALDLAEDKEQDEIIEYFKHAAMIYPNRPANELLNGFINMKVGEELLKTLGFTAHRYLKDLSQHDFMKIAQAVKGWTFPVVGLPDWDKAQVTAGGVDLKQIDKTTMQSRKVPKLYMTGELLNVHGDCGGYNLHFAWISGILAGQSAAKKQIALGDL